MQSSGSTKAFCICKRKGGDWIHFKTRMLLSGLNEMDVFGTIPWEPKSSFETQPETMELEYLHYLQVCCQSVASDENQNLSGPQKELLLWHWKLGTSMYCIQEMMREVQTKDEHGRETISPPVFKPKFASTPNCKVPMCMSCKLARAQCRNAEVSTSKPVTDEKDILSWDWYEVGDFFLGDQFVVTIPGRLPSGFGQEGATIFRDAASGVIWVEDQVSLGAGKTVMANAKFAEWFWEQAAAEIRHLHSDISIFTSDVFQEDCDKKSQSQSFSAVGAQHQNAQAEQAIQTIIYMARTFLIHVSLHWSDRGVDDLSLWLFAVKHAAWLYNRVPNHVSGLSPIEIATHTKTNHKDLLRTHVWGCPVFVLEPRLQEMELMFLPWTVSGIL